MWFILVFLCAFRTANPLLERRRLGPLEDDLSELDVDSVLNSPEDVESLVDLANSGADILGNDYAVGGDAPSEEDEDNGFDFDEDPDNILRTDELLADEEKSVRESVGQPPEVLEKYGHSKYDGPNRPGKLHDGERPEETEEKHDGERPEETEEKHDGERPEEIEEKGEPKDDSEDSDDSASDDSDGDKKDGDDSDESQEDTHHIAIVVHHPPIVVPAHSGPSPSEVVPAKYEDDAKGSGEPETKGSGEPETKEDHFVTRVHHSEHSDHHAAEMVKAQTSHSTITSPKVAEVVHHGTTSDSSHKRYEILKPLKIPYSQLPEHIRPPNWMKGYKLVPKEKPMEKPDYDQVNFETPVTTHPATPNRILDVDAPNPAFYTRPPTASPPPRPVVKTVLHTYKLQPSDELMDLLEHPPPVPTLPKLSTTEKPKPILPEAFLRYLKSMAKSRREEFMKALTKSNEKSRKLFMSLVEKIIAVSEQGKDLDKKRQENLQDTLEKLEDNMDKRFDEFKNEQKAKYASKLSKARSKLQKMEEQQQVLQKQLRDAVVDVKQEVSDDLAEARKAHDQENRAGRLERKHLRSEIAKLKESNELVVENEEGLLKKLNRIRKKKGKKPLLENAPAKVTPSLHVHVIQGDIPIPVFAKYRCNSCRTSQCRSACHRCNNCKTDRCRNVCRCGRTYRTNLRRLKHELDRLKRTWGRRNRLQQRRLVRVLRDKLRRFREKFQRALLAGTPKKPTKKPIKKSGKFRTLLFGSWAKRSHRRLYRLLEKNGVSTHAKKLVVRIFHKYYHRAMKEAAHWSDSDKRLSTYLSTVSKIWMKKAHYVLRSSKKKQLRKKKHREEKKKPKLPKPPKVKTTKPPEPIKLPKPKPLPPRPPPPPPMSDAEKPYAERLYTAWRARSEQFIDVHYDSIPPNRRAEVMGYVDRIFSLVRNKYIDYLSRDYAPGTRYSRRKRFLDWLVKVSEAVHDYVMNAILGKKFSTGIKNGYLDRIWMKWQKKSQKFVAKGMKKIHCKEKASDYIEDVFTNAKQAKMNHESMGSTKATKMKFLKYLVKTSKRLRAKVAFFQKTCKPVKGPRPYVTKMYKRWKRLSSAFVDKNMRRMCKDRYRDSVRDVWTKQKLEAEKKYLQFLNEEVKKMDAAESVQTAVSDDYSSDDDEEVAVGNLEKQLGVVDNWFIKHLKKGNS